MSKDKEIVISVKNVSKDFVLPHQKAGSVKSIFTNVFAIGNRTFEMQHALRDISFEIQKGEFFGIVGRNGSGKSTLLKILAGIYHPTKGAVKTHGRIVPFIELGVGFNPELTGRENVYLNGALLGFSEAEVSAKYEDIVDFAEIERFMDQKLKNYSSGMQVRLAFSVATVLAESDILLIDEVLAVGDADFQRKCFSYFKKLKKLKKTVVFVSHDMGAVREYCDRAVLIDKGLVMKAGKSDEVAKEYSKLFDDKGGNDNRSQGGKWGSGGVEITQVTTGKNQYSEEDKFINIEVKVTTKTDFPEGLVAGITIKNEADQPICGTNSKILRKETPALKKGESLAVEWQIPNVFNEGRFIIEPAIADVTSVSILQWWDSARSFRVTNEKKTPYIVVPDIHVRFATTKD